MVQTASRRERVRAATATEIKQTARRILVSEGPDAVSLRAIAREMGMTAPALYRYFGSHEELIKHVIADIFTELTADLQAAIAIRAVEFDKERSFIVAIGTPGPRDDGDDDSVLELRIGIRDSAAVDVWELKAKRRALVFHGRVFGGIGRFGQPLGAGDREPNGGKLEFAVLQ